MNTDPRWLMVDTAIRNRPDDSQCAFLFSVPGEADSPQGRANQEEALAALARFGACPDSPVDAGGRVTPVGAAEHAWYELVVLPVPSLAIQPRRAVTGLPTFLEIGGEREYRIEFGPEEALGYTITMDITSAYDIDWGDGTVFEGVTSQGGRYPHGDVRHTYQRVDPAVEIGVTQRWTAEWSAVGPGGISGGTIQNELHTDEAVALEVGQIQAVRNS